jgi:hypothetical protein
MTGAAQQPYKQFFEPNREDLLAEFARTLGTARPVAGDSPRIPARSRPVPPRVIIAFNTLE